MKQVFRRLAFLLVLLAVLLSVCYMLWPHSFADLQPECDSVTILRSDTAEDYSYTITKEIYSTDSPELKQIMDILSIILITVLSGRWQAQTIRVAITQVSGFTFIWITATTVWISPAAARARSSSTALSGTSATGVTAQSLP